MRLQQQLESLLSAAPDEVLQFFSIDCATRILIREQRINGRPVALESWQLLMATRLWLLGDITATQRDEILQRTDQVKMPYSHDYVVKACRPPGSAHFLLQDAISLVVKGPARSAERSWACKRLRFLMTAASYTCRWHLVYETPCHLPIEYVPIWDGKCVRLEREDAWLSLQERYEVRRRRKGRRGSKEPMPRWMIEPS